MILVTGATGFVGRRLTRRLIGESGLKVRVLLRPGGDTTSLPRSTPMHVVAAGLDDLDALRTAMDGVHTIYHLVGTDTRGRHARLQDVDLAGTRNLLTAARDARVGRIIYLSRVGADRGSAFPILRTKGEIEDLIRRSGLAYTIFRSSVLFGAGDRFSEHIAMLARVFPFFSVPGDGEMTLQPLWVEDMVTCLMLALEDLDLIDATITLGGPEVLSYRRMVMRVMYASRSQRTIIGLPLLFHRIGAWFFDGLFARWPYTEHEVELLSSNQTAELGMIERKFGFRPTSFDLHVLQTYLRNRWWALDLLTFIFSTRWD